MNVVNILCFVCSLAYVQATLPFKLGDCSSATANKLFTVDHVHLNNDPILIPGNETVDLDVHILQPISGDYTVKIRVQRHLLFGFVEVPCNTQNNIGSCTYKLCDILSGRHYNNTHHCPMQIAATSPDFECACPFAVGDYHLNPTTFEIHPLNFLLQWLASGDYKAEARIFDAAGVEVGCYFVHASTAPTGCTGAACIIGRRRSLRKN